MTGTGPKSAAYGESRLDRRWDDVAMGFPGPPPLTPGRPRPRRVWFFVGGGLVLVAVMTFVLLLVLLLSRSTRTDDVATLSTSGEPVSLDVVAGERRMLFAVEGQPAPRCTMTGADAEQVVLDPVGSSVTVGTDGTQWKGFATFTSRTDRVELTCDDAAPDQQVRVGAPLGAGFVGGILATIFVPLILGGGGVAMLVVTTIFWFTRAPRTG
jgi:hypothetical protein